MALDLVHHGLDAGGRQESLHFWRGKVGNADELRLSLFDKFFHRRPGDDIVRPRKFNVDNWLGKQSTFSFLG
jgi:hypothetical protein